MRWSAVVVALVGLGACASGAHTPGAVPADPLPAIVTEEYLPGLAADVHLPRVTSGVVPVVVLVPGGAWRTADRRGLTPLAARLAEGGIAAVNVSYRSGDDGVVFPVPVQDVTCAVAFAADRVRRAGGTPAPIVVLGHSSGAHLAVLAGLAADHFRGPCPYPATEAGAVAGLSGIYDVAAFAEVAEPLFGVPPAADPASWHDGNALTWVAARPSVRVFLAHGDADRLVPPATTEQLAAALEAAGHAVHVERVPGGGHHDTYAADVIAGPLTAWVASLG